MQARIDEQVNNAIKTINDSVDTRFKKIMNTPGTKDSDDDGIVDKFDKCPDVAGLFSNNGCPPVAEVAKAKEVEEAVDKSIAKAAPEAKPSTTPSTVAVAPSGATHSGLSDDQKYRLKNEIMVEMNPVRFEYNSYQLSAKSYDQLNTVAVIMRNNPNYKLNLKGFTDDLGSSEYNKKLSQNRANAVSEYLQSRGIAKDRIEIVALGKDQPLDDNNSRVGKANNRRVECKLQ
jgi:outer membrane protein OmpA-like peptidoglycan-associated protein